MELFLRNVYESFENKKLEDNNDLLEEKFLQFINESGPRDFGAKKPTLEKIKKSIINRQYVGIFYTPENSVADSTDGFRLIEPYAVFKGTRSKDGKIVKNPDIIYVRAYVIMDTEKDSVAKKLFTKGKARRKSTSNTKKYPYYRLFRFDRMEKWREMGITFSGYREKFESNDSLAGEMLASLSKSDFPKGEVPLK